MSRSETTEDLFKVLKGYEDRLKRLENANASAQTSPLSFAAEGLSSDFRLRRLSDGTSLVIEKLVGQNWVTFYGTDWVLPIFGNGWSAYSNSDPTFGQVRYRRNISGRIETRGLVAGGSGVMFNLPVGFRPIASVSPICICSASGGAAEVRASSNGDVYVNGYLAGGSNGWVSLEQFGFPTA